MGENIVASRTKLFVKIGTSLIFIFFIAGFFWHELFLVSLILVGISFSAEYQLINYQEKLSKRVIIPQLEGEVIDGISWLLGTSSFEDLETIFQRFEKYSTKNISRQQLLDIAIAADNLTISLRNGELWIDKQKTHV